MDTTRRRLVTALAAFAATGCLHDGGDGSDPEDDGENGDGDPDTAEVTVEVASHPELGDVLVDSEGMVLYMFDQDEQGAGASSCSGGCASAWPPLTVEEGVGVGDEVSAEVTMFERDDGSTQVAADGWPLYYYADDSGPGDAGGQGANDVWWVLRPDGTPVRDEG